MPIKRSGRSVAAASRVIEMDEVLVPTIASLLRPAQSAVKILRLTSSFSVAASITRSQSPRSLSVCAGLMRLSAAWRSSSLMRWRLTCRARLPLMVASPSEMRSTSISLSSTCRPASAHTWAMPLPICPAPMTPTLWMEWALPPWLPRVFGRSFTSTISAYPLRGVRPPRSTTALFKLLGQLWQSLVEVCHQPIIGDLKDGRFLILVDSDNNFRILHTGQMLDSAGNADGNIEVRRHDLSGLADLPIVRRIPGVDRRARRANRGTEFVGHRLYIFGEILAALHRPAAGNDDLGRRQLRALGLGQFLADKTGHAGIGGGCCRLDRSGPTFAGRLEGGGAHGDDLLGVERAHGLNGIAGIDRTLEGIGRHDLADLGNLHDVEQRRDPRHDVLSVRGRRREDRLVGLGERHDEGRRRLGKHVLVGGRVSEQYFLDTVELGCGIGGRLAIVAGDQHVDVGADLFGGGQRFVGGVLERFVVVFGEKKNRHQIAPASFFSLSMSSATVLTLTPALRPGGSDVLTISRCGLVSTPKSAAVLSSIGFFFAFMMLGSDA